MYYKTPALILSALLGAAVARSQSPDAPAPSAPAARAQFAERTVKAVNYQYRKGPTRIAFRGTELDPGAKGSAEVESQEGRTVIKARFDRLAEPTRLGSAYLTYVFWAITPEGRAANLGEIVPGHGKSSLHVTTHLQSFGLIVTAEPYAEVHQPSDAVVLEDRILPTTTGAIQPIEARYELLPRIQYSKASGPQEIQGGQKVSRSRYDETMAVYQAQNAVQIAAATGAQRFAPDSYARARELLRSAQQMLTHKGDKGAVIATAREAAQTAEDARDLASKRAKDAVLAAAVADAARERQRLLQAEAAAATAQAESQADRAMPERDRQERDRAQSSPAMAPAEQGNSGERQSPSEKQQGDLRFSIYQQLGSRSLDVALADVNDTPRGIVVTLPEQDFNLNVIQPPATHLVAQIASVLKENPGLMAEVSERGGPIDNNPRALAVRAMLLADGAPDGAVAVQPAATAPGAEPNPASGQQKGVDICIRGEPIGR